jgi:trans-aconitate methyltransferase
VSLVVLALVACAGGSIVWHTLALGISPMPSSRRVRDAVLAALPTDLEGEVHELGAGWGTLAVPLARRFPRAQVIAWESSWVPWAVLWLRGRALPNLEVRRADFFTADLTRARAVVCYLFTGAMERLSTKFHQELSRGAWVVSHTFALRGWVAATTVVVEDLYRTPVFVYRA